MIEPYDIQKNKSKMWLINMVEKMKRIGKKLSAGVRRSKHFFKRVAVGGLLLVSVLASSRAIAKPINRQVPRVTVRVGVGADIKKPSQTKPLIGLDVNIPLPKGELAIWGTASTTGSLGNRNVGIGLEDFGVDLGVPIAGPVGMDIYVYNDRHQGVKKAVGEDIWVSVNPHLSFIVGTEQNMDGPRPVFGIAKISAMNKKITMMPQIVWVTNKDFVGARFRAYLKISQKVKMYADYFLMTHPKTRDVLMNTINVGLSIGF